MHSTVPCLETLEERTLLSAITLKGRELIVRGESATGNDISVGFDGRQKNILLNLNGVQSVYKVGTVNLIDLIGGSGNDWLHVDETLAPFSIRVRLYGLGGDNALVGGAERDLIICGGAGDDTISTGSGDDTVVGGTGNDTIVLGKSFKLIFGAKGNNTITATGNGRGYIFGGSGANNIRTVGDNYEVFGGSGDDTLHGGRFDTLWGGGGHDLLIGGTERHYKQFKGVVKLRRILFPDIPPNLP